MPNESTLRSAQTSSVDFSLFYFADSATTASSDRYHFLFETARFADEKGFTAVWTPERHFHSFGGLYPNPSVLSAALSTVTQRIGIRAGSVVLPLHHPVRVCEEWSIVDNLSHGRVGISFASGWHPNDFAIAPDAYERRREITFERLELVRKLWRGERVRFPVPTGETYEPTLFPRPVQKELPVWITASGSVETFRRAGAAGANLLASLIGQSLSELADKIAVYRSARETAGLPSEEGVVTVMLHTFLADDSTFVRKVTRDPLRSYLESYIKQQDDIPSDYAQSPTTDLETQLDFAFERYLRSASLIGDPDSCAEMVERLMAAGANELACLVDFGIDLDLTMKSMELLAGLRDRFAHKGRAIGVGAYD